VEAAFFICGLSLARSDAWAFVARLQLATLSDSVREVVGAKKNAADAPIAELILGFHLNTDWIEILAIGLKAFYWPIAVLFEATSTVF
jgi:hypothetical protein